MFLIRREVNTLLLQQVKDVLTFADSARNVHRSLFQAAPAPCSWSVDLGSYMHAPPHKTSKSGLTKGRSQQAALICRQQHPSATHNKCRIHCLFDPQKFCTLQDFCALPYKLACTSKDWTLPNANTSGWTAEGDTSILKRRSWALGQEYLEQCLALTGCCNCQRFG